MKDDERKRLWDEIVEDAQFNYHSTGNLQDKVILSKDRELSALRESLDLLITDNKRMREAYLWLTTLIESIIRQRDEGVSMDYQYVLDELSRRLNRRAIFTNEEG